MSVASAGGPDGVEYYPQPDVDFEHGTDQGELGAAEGVPWIAVALAIHVLLLVIAWFLVPQVLTPPSARTIRAEMMTEMTPPVPELKPETETLYPDETDPKEKPAEDPKMAETNDIVNEDPTNDPSKELDSAENESNEPDSPAPDKNPNTSVGLGPGSGGGKGGGGGGLDFRRSGGDPGGKKRTVIDSSLAWLADHQNIEGYWSGTSFGEDSSRKGARRTGNLEFVRVGDPEGDKGWDSNIDVGLTGLAVLAFTAGGTDHKAGHFKNSVRRAIQYLRKVQNPDGCFGAKDDDHYVYNHAIATMAMAEVYCLSNDRLLQPVVTRAVGYLLRMQNAGFGWRYGERPGDNDTSVTGWVVLALKSAKIANIEIDTTHCYDDAANWLKTATVTVDGYPKTGYNTPGSDCSRLRSAGEFESYPSMDAINIMSMLFMGKASPRDAEIRTQAGVCAREIPRWEENKIDLYYWYYASLALDQVQGQGFKRWQDQVDKVLAGSQRGLRPEEKGETPETLDEYGSWDPVGAWGSAGGRVYATAINCLTLQTIGRFKRIADVAGFEDREKRR